MTNLSTLENQPLVLIGDYDYNLQQALKMTVNKLQQTFDMHRDMLCLWIYQENFKKLLEQKDKSCYLHFMRQKHPLLEKLLNVTHCERFVNDQLPHELEKCGHIMEEYSNGYIQFCNQHKFLHQTQHEDTFIKNDIDHFFAVKSPGEILDESVFKLKFNLYVQYTRMLMKKLENDFIQMINRTHDSFYVPYTEMEIILPWLEENPQNFRSKLSFFDQNKNIYLKIYQDHRDAEKPPCKYVKNLN